MNIGTVEQILPGGDALVRMDGASVLVANAVPGDVLELNLQGKRRGVLRGDVIRVVEASKQRVQAPCVVAGQCGGCALQCMAEAQQAELKSGWVRAAFKDLVETDTIVMHVKANDVESQGGHDRRRVRWFVGADEQGAFLGFYAPASHQAIRHDSCMVVAPALNAVRQWIEQHITLQSIDSVQAVLLDDGIHIVLETDVCPEVIDKDIDAMHGFALQWWWRDAQRITRPLHKPVRVFHDVLAAGNANISLAVGPDDFVQGQQHGNRQLIGQIQQWAGSVNRIADLFCGIGNLSLPLAAATGAEVFAAELNPASVRAASTNAKRLAISAQCVVANLFEDFDKEAYIGADVLILDPPRRGAKRLCQQMGALMPKKIIMVSCDVAAGARDGELLRHQGYRLKALRALDLFSFAGHVEAMSLWEAE